MHYVCSDIHGRWDRYQRLYEEAGIGPEDTLYILGDVIDRGPEGIRILVDVMERPGVEFFIGNHELFLYMAFRGADEDVLDLWLMNGGEPTIRAFMKLEEAQQERILNFLESSYIAIPNLRVGEELFYLVHAAPCADYLDKPVRYRDLKEGEGKTLSLMVWSRIDRLMWKGGKQRDKICLTDRRAVVGHTITTFFSPFNRSESGCPRIHFDKYFIGIDCGCACPGESGSLGVLRLEDKKEFYIEEET